MKRSKIIFFAIAAICVVVVLILLLSNPNKPEPGTTTAPQNYPTSPLVPNSTGSIPQGSNPTGPKPSTPQGSTPDIFDDIDDNRPGYLKFTPEEIGYEDLPASSGNHYLNSGQVSCSVKVEDYTLTISFGMQTKGPNNYLYLSPEVKAYGSTYDNGEQVNCAFYYKPADGYVTTISKREHGHYQREHSTFIRAFDYALPASYISSDEPGTVWYTVDGTVDYLSEDYCTYIDVLVFDNGKLVATLRLLLDQDASGAFYLQCVMDKNQLAEDRSDPYELVEQLTATEFSNLMEQFKKDMNMSFNPSGVYFPDIENADMSSFIIERRIAGEGTYFSYITDTTSYRNVCEAAPHTGEELIAIVVPLARTLPEPASAIVYYKVLHGAGESGEDLYEWIGADSIEYFWRRGLHNAVYPGYSKNYKD